MESGIQELKVQKMCVKHYCTKAEANVHWQKVCLTLEQKHNHEKQGINILHGLSCHTYHATVSKSIVRTTFHLSKERS